MSHSFNTSWMFNSFTASWMWLRICLPTVITNEPLWGFCAVPLEICYSYLLHNKFYVNIRLSSLSNHFLCFLQHKTQNTFSFRMEFVWKCNLREHEELNDLYSSPNIVRVIKSRRMRWAVHVARMGEERGVYRILVGKPEGRRPLGRPRRRWVDYIRMDLQEVGCRFMDWIGLAQDRDRWRTLVIVVMNLRILWNAGNFLTSCKPVSFSRRTLHHGVSK